MKNNSSGYSLDSINLKDIKNKKLNNDTYIVEPTKDEQKTFLYWNLYSTVCEFKLNKTMRNNNG